MTQVGHPSRHRCCHPPELILQRERPTHHPLDVVLPFRLAAQHCLFAPRLDRHVKPGPNRCSTAGRWWCGRPGFGSALACGNATTPPRDLCAQFGVPTKTTPPSEACYFNARSFPKGDGKGKRTSTPGSTNVNAVEGTASDNGELTSTIAALQQQIAAFRLTGASSMRSAAKATRSKASFHKKNNRCGLQTLRLRLPKPSVPQCMVTKGILVDSGATTSCANAKPFPTSKRKQLRAVNGMPIQQQGELADHTTLSATTADGEDIKTPARFRLSYGRHQPCPYPYPYVTFAACTPRTSAKLTLLYHPCHLHHPLVLICCPLPLLQSPSVLAQNMELLLTQTVCRKRYRHHAAKVARIQVWHNELTECLISGKVCGMHRNPG